MNNANFEFLMKVGYPEGIGKKIAHDLDSLSPELKPLWMAYMENNEEQADFSVGEFSIRKFMEKEKMNYIAAILTIDWFIKDPKSALEGYRKGGVR